MLYPVSLCAVVFLPTPRPSGVYKHLGDQEDQRGSSLPQWLLEASLLQQPQKAEKAVPWEDTTRAHGILVKLSQKEKFPQGRDLLLTPYHKPLRTLPSTARWVSLLSAADKRLWKQRCIWKHHDLARTGAELPNTWKVFGILSLL